jgi:hypothetical protein
VLSPSAPAYATGEFRELPGPPPNVDARRQAFRTVMRRLLSAPPQDPEPAEPEGHEERTDTAA